MSTLTYEEALEILAESTKFGINLGLERIGSLLNCFGNPQERLAVIHVGGTNGKGSTCAMLAAMLKQAGYRVGLYISPHLSSYRERIAINGELISGADFADLLSEMTPFFRTVSAQTGENPTEFEVLTAMAMLYFYRQKVDICILEVGMGGSIDSTNIIKEPLLSIITNVSLDHMDYLGNTLEKIAEVKSGIIKAKRPVITASEEEPVLAVIQKKARELQAPLYQAGKVVACSLIRENEEGQVFTARSTQRDYGRLNLGLLGEHQLANAATALTAVEILAAGGWQIDIAAIRQGLAQVRWPGRLEILRKEPLVVIDGAHNPAGMEMLARWLKGMKARCNRVVLVIGMLADKDRSKAVQFIKPYVDQVIVTRPVSPRAGDWQQLARCFDLNEQDIFIEERLSAALELALGLVEKRDMLLVTGSLYLIGEVRQRLGEC